MFSLFKFARDNGRLEYHLFVKHREIIKGPTTIKKNCLVYFKFA